MAQDLENPSLDQPVTVPEEPYHAAIMARWRIEPFAEAAESAAEIYELYLRYRDSGDFAGMEMVRRALQLGFTEARSRTPSGPPTFPLRPKPADVFWKTYRMVRNDPAFAEMRQAYLASTGQGKDSET